MTIPYDMGPDCQPSGKPFENRFPRASLRLEPLTVTYSLPPPRLERFKTERPRPDGPPPLVSASWQALMSSLGARHRAEMDFRRYFEKLARV